jgi:hypothetical protein
MHGPLKMIIERAFWGPGFGGFREAGNPTAAQIYFNLGTSGPLVGGIFDVLLSSDFDGLTAPPAGRPNTFAIMMTNEFGGGQTDAIRLFDFHAMAGRLPSLSASRESPYPLQRALKLVNESCPPFNGAADPGNRVSVNLKVINNGAGSLTNLW